MTDIEMGKLGKMHSLTFREMHFSIKGKNIIQDISAQVNSGEIMAIMGPSGAGKTTALNVLTLQAFGGRAEGEVLLDGYAVDLGTFKRDCALVEQEDNHWAFLTPRETLQAAAGLYLACDVEARKQKVQELLDRLGLGQCADTKVGNQFVKGLSGGQKRRLSIALAMLKAPLVIFLDEPTSGLDSASATEVMRFLKQIAAETGLIIVCTIHQPSKSVYDSFDQLLIMSMGRVAFTGDRASAQAHWHSMGRPFPAATNPAEFMLEEVNCDFTDKDKVTSLLDFWAQKQQEGQKMKQQQRQTAATDEVDQGRMGAPFWRQVLGLLRRHALLSTRDPLVYVGRIGFFLCCTVFFAAVYWKARRHEQHQAVERTFFFCWLMGVPAQMAIIVVYACSVESRTIHREAKNGLVSPLAFLLARALIELPVMLLLSVAAVSVGGYGMMGFNPGAFGTTVAVLAAMLWCFECMAQCMSSVFRNPLLGMMAFVQLWFIAFLFAGMFNAEEDIIWPFRVFCYVSPLRYTMRSLVYLDFHGTSWGCGPAGSLAVGSTQPCKVALTGDDVMDAIGATAVPGVSSADTVAMDIGMIVAIGVFFKMCYFALTIMRINRTVVVHPSRQPAVTKATASTAPSSTEP